MSRVDAEDRQLVCDFLASTVGDFGHARHVRVAWALLELVGLERALALFPEGVRRIAARHVNPNLYHATITLSYLFLIDERRRRGPDGPWSEFAAANADLLAWKPSVLDRYYSSDRLWSGDARSFFVLPDRGLDG